MSARHRISLNGNARAHAQEAPVIGSLAVHRVEMLGVDGGHRHRAGADAALLARAMPTAMEVIDLAIEFGSRPMFRPYVRID